MHYVYWFSCSKIITIIQIQFRGEFKLEVQHTSNVKDIQSFPLFLRHPESGKFLGITFIPPMNGLGGFLFVSEEEYHLNVVLMLLQEDY